MIRFVGSGVRVCCECFEACPEGSTSALIELPHFLQRQVTLPRVV